MKSEPESTTIRKNYHWIWSAFSSVVVLLTVAFRYALPVRDGDLWFHMLYGKYLLENRTMIPDHTIFSWTPASNESIYCTWLPDIFLYLLHKAAGLPGLFAFRYACLFFFVFLCFLFARRLRTAANPVVWLCILIGVLLSYVAAFLKPEILSYVLMTLLVWNWWHIRTGSKYSHFWCYTIPIIMLLWVNCHGAFIFGYMFIATIFVGELFNVRWSRGNALPNKTRIHLWIALCISLFIPLANPYGFHYPVQLFWNLLPDPNNTAALSRVNAYSPTFRDISTYHAYSLYINLAALLFIVLYLLNVRIKQIEWSSVFSFLLFAGLYTFFLRTTFFIAPVFVFSGISLISNLEKEGGFASNRMRYGLLCITLPALVWLSTDAVHTGFTRPEELHKAGQFGISHRNPIDSAKYIKQHFSPSKIGSTYMTGAFLLWNLWPDSKVSVDARYFPYREWIDEFFAFCEGKNFSGFLSKYPADIWCIDHGNLHLYSHFLYSSNWKLAFYGRDSSVFIPANISLPEGEKFQVEPNILDMDNINVTLFAYFFALKSHDWQTANALLSLIETSFNHPRNKTYVESSKIVFSGMKAFAGKEYQKAIAMLEKFSTTFRMEIAISHLHLAQKYLNAKQYDQARLHVRAAVKADTLSAYNAFNAALINWILYHYKSEYHIERIKESFTENFNEFVLLSGNDLDLTEQVKIARRILSVGFEAAQELPQLLIPRFQNEYHLPSPSGAL